MGIGCHPEMAVGVVGDDVSLWLPHVLSIVVVSGTSAVKRLPPPYSKPPKAFSLARVALNVVVVFDHTKAVSSH